MPPLQQTQVLLSPAELSYLHSSLSAQPPIRPDGRGPTQFRPVIAETDILPSANGSARVCFADGTEAIAGVKAEVEKSEWRPDISKGGEGGGDVEMGGDHDVADTGVKGAGENAWVEMTIDIPGFRDDDPLPVFLASMLTESLLCTSTLRDRLYINRRFHWRLYIDILLLSPPTSFPLPLLSLTTNLALRTAQLPRLISEGDEDPLFDDDWAAAIPIYPSPNSTTSPSSSTPQDLPPVTLLVATVDDTIIFDPSAEELAVADAAIAVSCCSRHSSTRVLSIRTVDPPSRLTTAGIPNALNPVTGGTAPPSAAEGVWLREGMGAEGVWRAPRGGLKRTLVGRIMKEVTGGDAPGGKGGVAGEVFEALESFVPAEA